MKFKGMTLPEILKIRQINNPNNRVNRKSLQTLIGKKNLIGVEIGVSTGDNAFDMLVKLDIDTLYLVDPYSAFKQWTQEKLDEHLEMAQGLLENFNNKIIWLKQPSTEAIVDIEDNLDFVYVDGDHSYRGCYDDLQIYWRKIKSGGILCGDNWECFTVRSAVNNFAKIIDQTFCFQQNIDVNSIDFWFIKK